MKRILAIAGLFLLWFLLPKLARSDLRHRWLGFEIRRHLKRATVHPSDYEDMGMGEVPREAA